MGANVIECFVCEHINSSDCSAQIVHKEKINKGCMS